MNFIQKYPILFAIVLIAFILAIAAAVVYFVIAPRYSNQQTVVTSVVQKKPADLTDDELVVIWKSLGCSSEPGAAINNAASKAFWRKFDTIDNMKKDMATWFAMRNKSKANTIGCLGNSAASVVQKKPADLTDDELVVIWKSLGCSSEPGAAINNAASKAFWRKFDTIDNMKKDMATWFAMRNKSKANTIGCLGNSAASAPTKAAEYFTNPRGFYYDSPFY